MMKTQPPARGPLAAYPDKMDINIGIRLFRCQIADIARRLCLVTLLISKQGALHSKASVVPSELKLLDPLALCTK
jgi:hypothetical protein